MGTSTSQVPQPHLRIRCSSQGDLCKSGEVRYYGGTGPKFCMFHKRGLLPLPPVEHTKLRSCTCTSVHESVALKKVQISAGSEIRVKKYVYSKVSSSGHLYY